MPTYKKAINEKPVSKSDERHYHTLEKIDLSDIAQAIDGGRSSQDEDDNFKTYNKNQRNESLKLKKFWFW